jgi:hypothetical protein
MNRKSRTSRAAVAVLAALMAIVLIGCSGSGPSTTGPSAVATDPTTVVVFSWTFEEVEAGGQRFINFSLPRRGALALTVRWNDRNNSVVAVLTGTGCFNLQNPTADCQVRRTLARQGKEGGEGFLDYPDAGGSYRLLVENEGPGIETINVTAELTSAVVAPAPPTPRPTDRPERGRPERERPNPRGSGQP